MPAALETALPPLGEQAERLIARGVHDVAGLSATALRAAAGWDDRMDALLVVHPDRAPAILGAGRTPLTLGEGLHRLVQRPDAP